MVYPGACVGHMLVPYILCVMLQALLRSVVYYNDALEPDLDALSRVISVSFCVK